MAKEDQIESDLDAGIALVRRVTEDLKSAQAEIASFDAQMEKAANLASMVMTRAEDLAQSLGSAPSELQEKVLTAIQIPVDAVVDDFTDAMDELGQELVDVIQGDQGIQAILDSMGSVTQKINAIQGVTLERKNELLVVMETADGELNDFVSAFQRISVAFQDQTDTLFGEFEEFIDEAIVEPIEEEGERLAAAWSDLIKGELTEVIEETMQQVSESIEQPVSQAIDALEDAARREIAALRESLITGNTGGDETRAVLEEAIDTIKSAIEPLEAAFDAFKSLAGVVGVRL